MNRQQFNSRNNISNIFTFQKSGSTTSFDPQVTFVGFGRCSWRLFNGTTTTQIAGNSITYTGFTTDTAIRNVELRKNSFNRMSTFFINNDNLYGDLDMSNFTEISGTFRVDDNPNLTGITHGPSSQNISSYIANNCNITGNLDLTPLSGLGGSFNVRNNSNLTGITHSPSPNTFSLYWAYECNLIGNHNMPFTGLGGNFTIRNNSNLTGITHSPSSSNFSNYEASFCNLTGNLNLSGLSGLGGTFFLQNNPNLTEITHSPSPNNFSAYWVANCNLTGNHTIPFTGLGNSLTLASNSNLTGITHYPSSRQFVTYAVNVCNITGNLDLTPLSGLGGSLSFWSNSNLTGITHSPSPFYVTNYTAELCDLTGAHDISMLLIGSTAATATRISFYGNSNLTNIIFPNVNSLFRNNVNSEPAGIFALYSCNLDYVDFKPLSGSTLLSGATQGNPRISLRDNGMIVDDVNHILVDFSGNATYNPTGWSNVNLNIGGSNADPDSSSGGYDGLAAISFLTGSPYNWTITY